MKWILGLAAMAALFWWFFLREKPDCGCGGHKDTLPKKSGGCGCNKTAEPNTQQLGTITEPTNVLKSNFLYDEPASTPNGELGRPLSADEQMLIERGTYKSVFGDEGDAGESETYE